MGILLPGTVKAAETDGFYQYEVHDNEVTITKYTGGETAVRIPSKIKGKSVTVIGGWAFEDNQWMTSVNIPSTVREIEGAAFRNCDSLKTVTIPNTVTQIGNPAFVCEAFAYCDNLQKVAIGNGLKEIPNTCFKECPKLKTVTIGKNVQSIGSEAFSKCVSLTSITIPGSVKEIGSFAFAENTALKTLVLNNGLNRIDSKAFYHCDSLQEVTIPNTVTQIGDPAFVCEAFAYCSNLQKVVIGSGLKEIPNTCFKECPKLKTVKIGKNVQSIDGEAFYKCESLTSITIPGSVKVIGGSAFAENTALKKLVLNKGLNKIEPKAFYHCASLLEVTIPNTVTQLGDPVYVSKVFAQCDELKKITIPNSVKTIENTLLNDSNNAVIYGYAGSAANTYADENNIPFVPLSAVRSTSLRFAKKSVSLFPEQTYLAEYTVLPAATTDAISWSSSNEEIASVDNIGIIEAKREGQVSIIAKTTSGKMASLTVKVLRNPETLNFSKQSVSIQVGKTYTQAVKVDNGTRKDVPVTYTSSNKKIATVDKNGKVKGIAAGTVKITATTHNGLKAYYTVQVVKPVKAISLNKETVTIIHGKSFTLKASLNKGASETILFKSSNTNIAPVNSDGKIWAKSTGKATVTVYTASGKSTACTVYVIPKKVTVAKPAAKKKAAVISWKKLSSVTGYEIYMSQKKSEGYKKIAAVKANTLRYTKKSLSSGKTYYFKVRAYKTIDGKKKYGTFSDIVKVKVK
ncbi:MAG: leucine-rich repeat protein [Lachnospiraceae bacterium]|nr:leucine-rich repeat protein [Lachnospiraceae bacterium]